MTIATSGVLLTRGRWVAELSGSVGSEGRYDVRWGAVHFAAYAAFSLCSAKVFVEGDGATPFDPRWLVPWLGSGLLTAGSLVGFVARREAGRVARVLARGAAAGLVLGTLAWFAAMNAPDLWPRLAGVTLRATAALLRIAGGNVVADEAAHIVGSDGFSVEIAPFCSGVEGMALVAVFVTAYLLRFRRGLVFPRALVLLPLSVAIAFAANALRIAALVLVGAHVSSDVALGGFHSKAGWFLFCAIALSVVGVVEWTGFFAREPARAAGPRTQDLTFAYLLPELTLLVVALCTGLFASGVDFSYPVRVVCAAAVLLSVGAHLRGAIRAPSWTSVLLGVLVFGVWLVLAPRGAPELASELHETLLGWSPLSRTGFVLFRIVGSVIVVPIAEELAFRGYLQRRLVTRDFTDVSLRRITAVSLAGTALCFGALHHAFAAAFVASLAYSAAAYVRGRLTDAVVAHATTNALIAVWVLALGRWDLWV